MNEMDVKHMRTCLDKEVPENTKGHVVYWVGEKTNCFEFRKIYGSNEEELGGEYVFEFDVYTKLKVDFKAIEHVVLTEFNAHQDHGDKYNLKELYDH